MKFDTRGRATINISSTGDTTVIAGITGSQTDIDHFNFVVSGADATITLKDDSTTIVSYPLVNHSTFVFDNVNPSLNEFRINGTFVINLVGAGAVLNGFILYRVNT